MTKFLCRVRHLYKNRPHSRESVTLFSTPRFYIENIRWVLPDIYHIHNCMRTVECEWSKMAPKINEKPQIVALPCSLNIAHKRHCIDCKALHKNTLLLNMANFGRIMHLYRINSFHLGYAHRLAFASTLASQQVEQYYILMIYSVGRDCCCERK